MALIVYCGNDNLITLDQVFDKATNAYVNDATVEATLVDRAGTIVATVAMAYVAASEGRYIGVLPAATAIVAGAAYRLNVSAIATATGLWQLPVKAQFRESP